MDISNKKTPRLRKGTLRFAQAGVYSESANPFRTVFTASSRAPFQDEFTARGRETNMFIDPTFSIRRRRTLRAAFDYYLKHFNRKPPVYYRGTQPGNNDFNQFNEKKIQRPRAAKTSCPPPTLSAISVTKDDFKKISVDEAGLRALRIQALSLLTTPKGPGSTGSPVYLKRSRRN